MNRMRMLQYLQRFFFTNLELTFLYTAYFKFCVIVMTWSQMLEVSNPSQTTLGMRTQVTQPR